MSARSEQFYPWRYSFQLPAPLLREVQKHWQGTLYDTGCGFPAFQPEGDNTVAAELIEIPFEDWEAVDRLEGYPRLYDRLMFPAKLADGTDTTGWVYVMHNLPEMAQVIESGSWKEYRHG